jgi:hypothetical protein
MITGRDQDEDSSESMGFIDVSQDIEPKASLTRASSSTQNTEHEHGVRSAIQFATLPSPLSALMNPGPLNDPIAKPAPIAPGRVLSHDPQPMRLRP